MAGVLAGEFLGKMAGPLIGAAAMGLMGAIAWNYTPFIGPAVTEARLKNDVKTITANRDDWKRQFEGEQGSFNTSETMRKEEASQDATSATSASKICDTRVAEARRSASAIHATVSKEPAHVAQGCPARELVPIDELRNDLKAGAAPGR